MRQLHILFNKPKFDIGWFVDFCIFNSFYRFLHDVLIKIFCRSKQELVKTGRCTEINKQSHVKFWLNWRKYRTVSHIHLAVPISQNLNLKSDCLLTSVYLPVFAWCAHKIVLQIKTKTGKCTHINKQYYVKFWLNWRKYRTVSYSFSCTIIR